MTERRVEVEPRGGAVGDPDLDPARPGRSDDRAAVDGSDADVAVGGRGRERVVAALDLDVSVCGLDPQLAADLADVNVAIRVLDHGRAVDFAGAHLAHGGGELGVPGRPLDQDVAGRDQLHRRCAVEPDLAGAAPQLTAAQRPGAAKGADRRMPDQLRARRQPDLLHRSSHHRWTGSIPAAAVVF